MTPGRLKKLPQVVIVYGDDWQGMFLDGKLLVEGHSLHPREIIEALGLPCEEKLADTDWLETKGVFPEKLEDVKWEG